MDQMIRGAKRGRRGAGTLDGNYCVSAPFPGFSITQTGVLPDGFCCGVCLCVRYAIACFLLQAKDRHNGNLLLDSEGRLVHIDFGFILEISPGGNLGFENAAFKLSHEMSQILDPSGDRSSPQYRHFQELAVRGYLVVRCRACQISAYFVELRVSCVWCCRVTWLKTRI